MSFLKDRFILLFVSVLIGFSIPIKWWYPSPCFPSDGICAAAVDARIQPIILHIVRNITNVAGFGVAIIMLVIGLLLSFVVYFLLRLFLKLLKIS